MQAAELAIESSADYLGLIRDATEPTEFAKFLGIAVSSGSLCFVVDTTGSMADEMVAVRETIIRITRTQSSKEFSKPADYVPRSVQRFKSVVQII